MADYYRDTDERMARDPEFRRAVDGLEAAARQNAFTPGELKQIAFAAALRLEQSARCVFGFCANCGAIMPKGSACFECGGHELATKIPKEWEQTFRPTGERNG